MNKERTKEQLFQQNVAAFSLMLLEPEGLKRVVRYAAAVATMLEDRGLVGEATEWVNEFAVELDGKKRE
jgi:hypothetical protein